MCKSESNLSSDCSTIDRKIEKSIRRNSSMIAAQIVRNLFTYHMKRDFPLSSSSFQSRLIKKNS